MRRFLRTTLFMRILPSSHVSSASTMQTVSLRFLPLMSTVSPRKSCSSSIFFGCSATTELSSLDASSTTRRLGDFLRSRMASDASLPLGLSPALAGCAAGAEGPASSAMAAGARAGSSTRFRDVKRAGKAREL